MSKTLQFNKEKDSIKNIIENNNKNINKEIIKESINIREDKNNLDYYSKRKFVSKFIKKSITNKRAIKERPGPLRQIAKVLQLFCNLTKRPCENGGMLTRKRTQSMPSAFMLWALR
jgi:hypothetical protein